MLFVSLNVSAKFKPGVFVESQAMIYQEEYSSETSFLLGRALSQKAALFVKCTSISQGT